MCQIFLFLVKNKRHLAHLKERGGLFGHICPIEILFFLFHVVLSHSTVNTRWGLTRSERDYPESGDISVEFGTDHCFDQFSHFIIATMEFQLHLRGE